MRTVDFSQRLFSWRGTPMRNIYEIETDDKGEFVAQHKEDMTVLGVCADSLADVTAGPGEKPLDGKRMLVRNRLLNRLSDLMDEDGVLKPLAALDLNDDEVRLLKEAVANHFSRGSLARLGGQVVGQVWDILEPPVEKDDTKSDKKTAAEPTVVK